MSDHTSEASVPPMFSEGKALVIGGSGGLGGAIAQSLALHGSEVVLSYRNGEDRAREYAANITALGGTASTTYVDPLEINSIKTFFEEIGGGSTIHSVIMAAGPHIHLEPIAKSDTTRLQEYLTADVIGFTNVVQAALPYLRKSKGSITALVTCGIRQWLHHDILSIVPKSAVWSLIQGIAREEGRHWVRANAVGVGVIDAGMSTRGVESGQFDDAFFDSVKKSCALRRIGTASDVAEAVSFLASKRASYITGELINVDGGLAG